MTAIRIEELKGFDLKLEQQAWAFADAERNRIDAHWQTCFAANPRLWNGEVLICMKAHVADGVLSARFAITDFASFIAWRDWGWPDDSVLNCFGVPAVISADAALLFGVMGPHTLNAGLCYPPAGSLEPRDVLPDGRVDIRKSMALELAEETGLDTAAARPGRLLAIFDGPRLAVVEEYAFPHPFDEMRAIFRRHIHGNPAPELASIEAIHSPAQIDRRMPRYAQHIVRMFASPVARAGNPVDHRPR